MATTSIATTVLATTVIVTTAFTGSSSNCNNRQNISQAISRSDQSGSVRLMHVKGKFEISQTDR